MHKALGISKQMESGLLLIGGVLVLGFFLILGPFGLPGDAAGLAMISGAGANLLSHGK